MNSVREIAGSTAEIADFGEVVDDIVDLVADIDVANADIVALVAGIAESLADSLNNPLVAFVEAADIACSAVEGCWVDEMFVLVVDETFVLVVAEIFARFVFVCKGFFYLGTAAADCNLGQTLELEN